jgi:hypothetical protein
MRARAAETTDPSPFWLPAVEAWKEEWVGHTSVSGFIISMAPLH